jgi:hypothetical protein
MRGATDGCAYVACECLQEVLIDTCIFVRAVRELGARELEE